VLASILFLNFYSNGMGSCGQLWAAMGSISGSERMDWEKGKEKKNGGF